MSNEVMNYKCPACSGALHFASGSGKLECDYCGGSYEVAEVEALFKEKEERIARERSEQEAAQWEINREAEWSGDADAMKSFTCPSCGAELICDQNTSATCCPYCDNPTVVPGNFSGVLKPEYVIPFKTDKEHAKAALKEHYKGKWLLPKAFAEQNHIDDIQGVYVPFWLFDCKANGHIQFHATKETTTKSGNIETTKTAHYDVVRSGSMEFEKVPVDASTRMPDQHMDSIEPYDYRELKPFSTAYMPGFLADKYDVEAEECGKRMEERCHRTVEEKLESTVQGYTKREAVEKHFTVEKGKVSYAMLPVWMLSTNWNGDNYLFAMNGQTGKLIGDLPVDKKKYWLSFAGFSILWIAIFALICNVFLSTPITGITFILVQFLVPVALGFICVSWLKSQLKSVTTQGAGNYTTEQGLALDIKTDTYLRTTTKTRTIQQN